MTNTPAPHLLNLLPDYHAYLIGECRRPSGRDNYRKTLAQFFRWLGDEVTNAELDARAVRRYKEYIAARGCSNSRVINVLACIRDFCYFARTEGYRTDDPTFGVRRPSKEQPDPKPLYEQDVTTLLTTLAEPPDLNGEQGWYWRRNRLMILLMLYTGLRRNEAAALRWRDVNLGAAELRVVKGKNARDRVVPIHPVLQVALEAVPLHERSNLQRTIISKPTGGALSGSSIDHIFDRWLSKLGFDLHAHILRHTFASHLVWNDVDLRSVQELLGHAQLSTTERYVKIDMRRKKRMVNRLPDFEAEGTHRYGDDTTDYGTCHD